MPPGPAGLSALHVRPDHPDFLDLPWHLPLEAWSAHSPRPLQLERGISRHPVVFAGFDRAIYVFKQLPGDLAEREYGLLRELEQRRLPAVEPVGHARVQGLPEDDGSVLITRFLEHSLPFRTLFMQRGLERYRERLLDTVASLLVKVHLGGVYWGDCSLSNTLFRRDAGELQAHLVDAETSETHERLSDGHREQDLQIMEENISGELCDVAAAMGEPPPVDPAEAGAEIRRRYERLWGEISREDYLAPDERWRIHERIRALNAMGFSVDEVELVAAGDGDHLRMRTLVTDRDYHRSLLHGLTGIVAGDRQAALMLNEIQELKATLSRTLNRSIPLSAAAYRWTAERFQPSVRRLERVASAADDRAELYCEVLEHKWYLSERARRDVGLEAAIQDYVEHVRPGPRADATSGTPAPTLGAPGAIGAPAPALGAPGAVGAPPEIAGEPPS